MPNDIRGIVLLCGYVGAAAFGVFALLTPPGDPVGWVYLAIAVLGYWFIPTRGLTAFLWLLVAGLGAAVALGGSPTGWIEVGIGLPLAVVGAWPAKPSIPRRGSLPSTVGLETNLAADASRNNGSPLAQDDPGAATRTAVAERPYLQTLGKFQFRQGDDDLTEGLERKPKLSFLFKYLLARLVLGRSEADRDGLSDEISPRIPQASQRERLRKLVYKLQNTTPPAIGSLIRTSPTHVWLELDEVDSDVKELRRLRDLLTGKGSMPDAALAGELRAALTRYEGDFLVGFEDLEQKANEAGGNAGQLVVEARDLIDNCRADLLVGLAEYDDSMGEPATCIPLLDKTLKALPARQDIARVLTVAYLKTGQTARAREIRQLFPNQE